MWRDGGLLEVLLEELTPQPRRGPPPVDPGTVESRTFNRFLAQEVAQGGGVVRIEVAGSVLGMRRAWIIVIVASIAAGMLLLFLRFARRSSSAPPAPVPLERPVERLAREIAELDARMERVTNAGDADRDAYAQRRAELKRALAAALTTSGARGKLTHNRRFADGSRKRCKSGASRHCTALNACSRRH